MIFRRLRVASSNALHAQQGPRTPDKFCVWKVKGQNRTSGQKWYCGINWVEFEQSYPQEWRALMLQHGNLPALELRMRDTFCGCRYRPYACGSASILEWMDPATGH